MMSRRRTYAVAGALCAAVIAAAGAHPAGAEDLDALKARAQSIADDVTALEQRLESLRARKAALQEEIIEIDAEIGTLELERAEAAAAERTARESFVEDAVEMYKNGSGVANLDLLLSAQNVGDLELFLEIGNAGATRAENMLRRAETERARAEKAQNKLDSRKERAMAAEARADRVANGIEGALEKRRAALAELTEEIKRLERRARRAAARTPDPPSELDRLLGGGPGGPARGIPNGYVATGVSFEGVASWYGPGFAGRPTASGTIFDPAKFTAASKELPLGTWLYVEHSGKGVVVLVNDRGPYIDGRVLDLSEAAAGAIGITGLGWIRAELLIKK